jgi:hypothetical protein
MQEKTQSVLRLTPAKIVVVVAGLCLLAAAIQKSTPVVAVVSAHNISLRSGLVVSHRGPLVFRVSFFLDSRVDTPVVY